MFGRLFRRAPLASVQLKKPLTGKAPLTLFHSAPPISNSTAIQRSKLETLRQRKAYLKQLRDVQLKMLLNNASDEDLSAAKDFMERLQGCATWSGMQKLMNSPETQRLLKDWGDSIDAAAISAVRLR